MILAKLKSGETYRELSLEFGISTYSMSNINPNAKIYAILADSVYWDVREGGTTARQQENSNWTPVPSDWRLISELRDEPSGFTARAYKNSNFS